MSPIVRLAEPSITYVRNSRVGACGGPHGSTDPSPAMRSFTISARYVVRAFRGVCSYSSPYDAGELPPSTHTWDQSRYHSYAVGSPNTVRVGPPQTFTGSPTGA